MPVTRKVCLCLCCERRYTNVYFNTIKCNTIQYNTIEVAEKLLSMSSPDFAYLSFYLQFMPLGNYCIPTEPQRKVYHVGSRLLTCISLFHRDRCQFIML